MSTITVYDGGLIVKDPSDVKVYTFDWDTENLAVGVTISSSAWAITALSPSSDTALTKDQASVLSGNRQTQIRLTGGTLGGLYQLDNTITTNESPAQTKQRSVRISIETR